MRRVGLIAAAVLLVGGAGVGAYAVGHGSAPSAGDAASARRDAFATARTRTERVAERHSRNRGYETGLDRGKDAGKQAGSERGSTAGQHDAQALIAQQQPPPSSVPPPFGTGPCQYQPNCGQPGDEPGETVFDEPE
jgi:hypothetical protein